MQKPPYFWRALLDVFLLLPLLFQAVAGAALLTLVIVLEALETRHAVAFVAVGAPFAIGFLFLCFRSARHTLRASVVRQAKFSNPAVVRVGSPRFIERYLPVVIGFVYTLAIALVALLFPVPDDGGIFERAAGVLAVAHLPCSFLLILGLVFGVPSIWPFLLPPLAIYFAYGCGLAWGFRSLHHPPTYPKGRLVAVSALIASVAAILWRADAMTEGFVKGGGRDERYAESRFNRDHQPYRADNKLVKIPAPTLTIERDHPVLDGATALYPVYAAAVQALYKNVGEENYYTLLHCSTTPEAYKRLVAREVDLVFVAQPSKEQQAAAEAAGNPLQLTPLGKEAFVFFVHADNPVDGLSSDQIRAIYTKKIVNWKEVGGRDEEIIPFQRPQGSGSQTALERKVMKGEKLPAPLREEFARGMGGVIQQVATYRNSSRAIGYSFRVYANAMNTEGGIKLLKIDGVAPTRETIRSGAYPYTADLFAATAGTTNPHVPALIAWFLSPQGQDLIEKTGYVSLPPFP